MMSSEIMKKHINARMKPFKVIGPNGEEDILYIRPLPAEFFPRLMALTEEFEKNKNSLSVKASEDMAILVVETLKRSCPEADDDTVREFAMLYYVDLMEAVMEINLGRMQEKAKTDPRIKKKLEELNAEQSASKNTEPIKTEDKI